MEKLGSQQMTIAKKQQKKKKQPEDVTVLTHGFCLLQWPLASLWLD